MSMTPDLFAANEPQLACVQNISLSKATLAYTPMLWDQETSDEYLQALLGQVDWKQERITLYGKTHNVPRLSAWYGDLGKDYTYSGVHAKAKPWTRSLLQIKKQVERHCLAEFNSVLVNLYRDGGDSVAWHSDDEPELGCNPTIASLSFGAPRDFHLRHKSNKDLKHKMTLENGSLLMMRGTTQTCWQHHIPKRAHADGRINLTFRTIIRTS